MAEVQTTTTSGEMTLQFLEFVRIHAQNASLCLGRIPHPHTGKTVMNLPVARVLIDQLAMIGHKTRGNLTSDEESVLNSTLSSLRLAFVEASKATPSTPPPSKEA